jgi:hypothetical protein
VPNPSYQTAPARGSAPEYDDLRRAWAALLAGLPKIDGWTITDPLPDIDELGQWFIDLMDIGEPPFAALEVGEQRPVSAPTREREHMADDQAPSSSSDSASASTCDHG